MDINRAWYKVKYPKNAESNMWIYVDNTYLHF